MPGGMALPLKAGDALLFHAWSIHRGRYVATQPRRTLDIIYGIGTPMDWSPAMPSCIRDPRVMEALSPNARAFYERFIAAHAPLWDRR